jgi:16S rRNA (cytidine1402-2'-O)-methyltransferase
LHSERAQEEGALYVVATPLGNLQDVTLRALSVLKSADLIAAEDTRVTRQLLQHFGIGARTVSLHQHNEPRAAEGVLALLQQGKSVALVSDAGTPAISDPGALLVKRARDSGARVVPVPGPSALTAALSVAGLRTREFVFLGFLPAQPGARRRALEAMRRLPFALVLYEAPHRVRETLADLARVLGAARGIVIARELTKLFETVHACTLGEACAWLDGDPNRQRGEFVLMVEGAAVPEDAQDEEGERVLGILLAELPVRQAAQLAAAITGAGKKRLYQRALELKGAVEGDAKAVADDE